MEIALDLENVIAHVNPLSLQKSDVLTMDNFQQWHFDDERTFAHFMDITHEIWSSHWDEIPPTEENIAGKVEVLKEYGAVDLVTNRDGVDHRIEMWLDDQNITVRNVHSNPQGTEKTEMGYHVYIDDNPNMVPKIPDGATLFLYDQPWNQGVNADEYDTVVRVKNITDVLDELSFRKQGVMADV